MTDEEGIDKNCTHILEGLHWMNEVSLRSKARVAASTMQRIEFEKASELLKDVRVNYQTLESEKMNLAIEKDNLAAENGRLLQELDQYS